MCARPDIVQMRRLCSVPMSKLSGPFSGCAGCEEWWWWYEGKNGEATVSVLDQQPSCSPEAAATADFHSPAPGLPH